MKKRLISVVLVLVMALSMTTTVFAADWESDIDTVGVAVVNNTYYPTVQEAVDAANGDTVKLLESTEETVTNSGVLRLDLNDCNVTINGGSVILIDSGTDDGTTGGELTGTITVADGNDVTSKDNIQYLVLEDGSVKTANAVRVKLKRVTIRPSAAGLYYTGEFKFNENVVAQGVTYGIVVSLENGINESFKEGEANKWTEKVPAAGKKVDDTGRSCLVKNIFSEDLVDSPEANAERGKLPIYADAYVQVGDKMFMAENSVKPVVYSLYSVSKAFDDMQGNGTLDATILKNMKSFYKTWKTAMDLWDLTHFKAAVEAEA